MSVLAKIQSKLQGSATVNYTAKPVYLNLPGTSGSFLNDGLGSPAVFNFSTSNCFIEAWVYMNSVSGTQYICGTNIVPATSDDWGFRVYGTALHAYTYLTPSGLSETYSAATNIIPARGYLSSTQRITSLNGSYYMIYQNDNNFVLYSGAYPGGTAIWAFNLGGGFPTYGSYTVGKIQLNGSGYLELLDGGGVSRWTSNSPSGTGPYRFVLQNDRNAVIYDSTNTSIWSTNTSVGGSIGQTTILSTGVLTHLAVSYQTNGNVTLFVNGTAQQSGLGISTPSTPKYTAGKSFWVGSTTGWDPTNGYIQDLRLIQGGIVPTTSFTAATVPFGLGSPTYVTGTSSTVYSLATQYMQTVSFYNAIGSSKISMYLAPLYPFTNFTFTAGGTVGQTGPTSLATMYGTNYPGYGTSNALTLTSGIQYWTVPVTGTYTFALAAPGYATGLFTFNSLWFNYTVYGAVGTTSLNLTRGHIIQILVGQNPNCVITTFGRYPGCGGTFVYNQTTSTLLCAVGGAGGSGVDNTNATGAGTNVSPYTACGGKGLNGSTTTTGGTPPSPSGAGGTNGNGGQGSQQSPPSYYGAAGGGGYLTDGGTGTPGASQGTGGKAFLNGGLGGVGVNNPSDYGGFGGGGACANIAGGGGAGGYSGGGGGATTGAGYGGGGGGSYTSASWSAIAATNSSTGYVTVTLS